MYSSKAHLSADALLDIVPDIIAALSPSGEFLSLNRAFETRTGWRREEWMGKPFAELLHPEDRARAIENLQSAVQLRQTIQHEVRILTAAGAYLEVEVVGTPQIENGQVISVIGAARDITFRKKLETELNRHRRELESAVRDRTLELLRANRELKRSNHDLEQFAYVVSHDIQEPLRAIATYSELLVRDFNQALPPDAREYVRYITDGVTRIQVLIRDLLEYSRVSRREALMEPVDSAETVRAAIDLLDVVVRAAHAEITVEALPMIQGNRPQILRLFQNLLANALKFQRPDSPPKISISAKSNGAHWVFAVADNGIGIDRKHHDRIFLLFQRLFTREEFPGSGVGLSICKRIVERHEGRIWVESEEGVGSTFYFTLPQVRDRSDLNHETFPEGQV